MTLKNPRLYLLRSGLLGGYWLSTCYEPGCAGATWMREAVSLLGQAPASGGRGREFGTQWKMVPAWCRDRSPGTPVASHGLRCSVRPGVRCPGLVRPSGLVEVLSFLLKSEGKNDGEPA